MNIGVPAVPMKWRKYLALVDFGFVSADELAADIRRYPISEVRRLVSDLRSDIRDDLRRARAKIRRVPTALSAWGARLPGAIRDQDHRPRRALE